MLPHSVPVRAQSTELSPHVCQSLHDTINTKREGSDGAQPGNYSCPAYVSGQLTGKLQSDCI